MPQIDARLMSQGCLRLNPNGCLQDILGRYSWVLSVSTLSEPTEIEKIKAVQEELAKNPAVQKDPLSLYMMDMSRLIATLFCQSVCFNNGKLQTADDVHEHLVLARDVWQPLMKQARDQCVGARWEFQNCLKNTQMIACGTHRACVDRCF